MNMPFGVFGLAWFAVMFAYGLAAVVVGLYVWERWLKRR